MKRFVVILIVFILSSSLRAQFNKATLQASGLTCAMCSNAINKALQALPFVTSVRSDIKNSAFEITFNGKSNVNIDALKNVVDDAGFSVAKLKLTGYFDGVKVANDQHVVINNNAYHFLNVSDQTLNGEKTITLIDKDFLTTREFKKYSSSTKFRCIQSGKAEACCTKEGIAENTRIYHVTI